MTIQIPTADLQAAFNTAVQTALASEQQLADSAKAQIQQLVATMYPQITAMTQELMDSPNPAVQQGYMAILEGIIAAKISELGLGALATQRKVIAGAITTGINIVGMLLKAAVAVA